MCFEKAITKLQKERYDLTGSGKKHMLLWLPFSQGK